MMSASEGGSWKSEGRLREFHIINQLLMRLEKLLMDNELSVLIQKMRHLGGNSVHF